MPFEFQCDICSNNHCNLLQHYTLKSNISRISLGLCIYKYVISGHGGFYALNGIGLMASCVSLCAYCLYLTFKPRVPCITKWHYCVCKSSTPVLWFSLCKEEVHFDSVSLRLVNHVWFLFAYRIVRGLNLHTQLSGCLHAYVDGILPKGPYPPCLRMADRALLAGYSRCILYEI